MGAYLSISWMTIKTCLHEKFQFFNIFCKRLPKNGHFDHFWDTKWGFTDPTTAFDNNLC